MRLGEIQPYVRYIHDFDPARFSRTVRACDHRIFYVHAGGMGIELPGGIYELGVTDLIYVPAGTAYRIASVGQGKAGVYGINFDFCQPPRGREGILNTVFGRPLSAGEATEVPEFSDTEVFFAPLHCQKETWADSLVASMLREYGEGGLWSREMIGALMKQLLLGLARREAAGDRKTCRVLEEAVEYIRKNCHRSLSNEEIGRALSFHPNYLNRLMVKGTGQTLHRFVITCRLNRAALLLQSTEMSISEIAEAVGFGDARQFSKCFHRQMGVTPGSFRRNV